MTNRLDRMRIEWEAERRMILARIAEEKFRLRDVEHRLRVFFGEGELAKRKYKSGTVWCLWRWTDVDSEYIVRLHLVKTPWFAICLHWIRKPDPEPFDHDHPVSFLSVVLEGAYAERRNGELHAVNWFNFIRANPNDRHTIVWVAPHTLTLCFMGPKRREWGFHRPNGWIGWKAYYAEQREASRG